MNFQLLERAWGVRRVLLLFKHVFDSIVRLKIEMLNPRWGSSKPIRCIRRGRASGELILCYPHILKSQGLIQGKETKKKVLDAIGAARVEKDENGKVELHGRTYLAWTSAVPGAPLQSGG